jgi:hypothetical protein
MNNGCEAFVNVLSWTFFVNIRRKWTFKTQNLLHKNICAGKFGMILVGTLVGIKKFNFLRGKHFVWETL